MKRLPLIRPFFYLFFAYQIITALLIGIQHLKKYAVIK